MKKFIMVSLLILAFCLALFPAYAENDTVTEVASASDGTFIEMEAGDLVSKGGAVKIRPYNWPKTIMLGETGYCSRYKVWYRRGSYPGSVHISSLTPSIAEWSGGYVYPYKIGTAKFRLSCDRAKYTCSIKIKGQPATDVLLSEYNLDLILGNTYTLEATVLPENYSDPTVTFSSSNKKVASIDKYGVITGKKEGDAVITVKSKTKGITATCYVHVYDPVTRRAVVIAECSGTHGSYQDESAKAGEKKGHEANLYGMASLFGKYKFQSVRTIENYPTWNSISAAIKSEFASADSDDISYIYINAHGGLLVNSSEYYLAIGSSSNYSEYACTAAQLKSTLDSIPGKKVLILESCHSGAIIGKGQYADADLDAALESFVNTFRGSSLTSKGTTISGNEYCVICSTTGSESSWYWYGGKIFGKKNFVGGLFTYWLAKGAGWDIVSKKSCTAGADSDKSKSINLEELFNYTYKNVETSKRKYCSSDVKQITVAYEGFSDALFVTKK